MKVTDCRRSGNCLIATLNREEMKSEVMRNKSKLRGEKFFIENDLTWEERKVQERIYRWAKQEREKGMFIKVGFARVQIRGVWRKWEEIEKKKKDREEREEVREEAEKRADDREKEGLGERRGEVDRNVEEKQSFV